MDKRIKEADVKKEREKAVRKKQRQEASGVDPFALEGSTVTTSWVCWKCRTQNHTNALSNSDGPVARAKDYKFHGPWCHGCGTVKRGKTLTEDEEKRHEMYMEVIHERDDDNKANRTEVKQVFLEDQAIRRREIRPAQTLELIIRSTEGFTYMFRLDKKKNLEEHIDGQFECYVKKIKANPKTGYIQDHGVDNPGAEPDTAGEFHISKNILHIKLPRLKHLCNHAGIKYWQSTKLHPDDEENVNLLRDALSESDESEDAKAAG